MATGIVSRKINFNQDGKSLSGIMHKVIKGFHPKAQGMVFLFMGTSIIAAKIYEMRAGVISDPTLMLLSPALFAYGIYSIISK